MESQTNNSRFLWNPCDRIATSAASAAKGGSRAATKIAIICLTPYLLIGLNSLVSRCHARGKIRICGASQGKIHYDWPAYKAAALIKF